MQLSTDIKKLAQVAQARRNAVLTEIAELTGKLGELKQQLSDIEGFSRTYTSLLGEESIPPLTPTVAQKRKKTTKQDRIITVVEQMLLTAPVVSTPAILTRLGEIGIDVGGKHPISNLSAILSKSPKFANSRAARGWILSTQ